MGSFSSEPPLAGGSVVSKTFRTQRRFSRLTLATRNYYDTGNSYSNFSVYPVDYKAVRRRRMKSSLKFAQT